MSQADALRDAGGLDAIVLAGGLGTRLASLVSDLPKPMAPVGGRPFLEILLDYWIAQGVRRFVISVGHLAGRIVEHFGSAYRGAAIEFALEARPLGTGGGLLLAQERVRTQHMLVLNGDTYFAADLQAVLRAHLDRDADCTIALHRSFDTRRYLGVSLGPDGSIRSLSATPPGQALVNGGCYVMRTSALRAVPWRPGDSMSVESDLLPHAVAHAWRIFGVECPGSFIDIGLPEDYRRAQAELNP
jgi:D-glycero-alpha-D-manno-heptose 1-phosphate guanylyltransferase